MHPQGIDFPERVFPDSVDHYFADVTREQNSNSLRHLTIDMSNVAFVALDGWQRIISYMVALARQGVEPTIIPPQKEAVVKYMRSFGVDYGFKTALNAGLLTYAPVELRMQAAQKEWVQPSIPFNVPMGVLVHESDQTVKRGNRNNQDRNGELPRRRTAFAFHTLDVSKVKNYSEAANIEKNIWMTPNVSSVFRSVTGESTEYFAPRVVFEGIFNSLRHEGATVIQTVTHFRDGKKPGDTSTLAVSFWDDGVGIFETMRSAFEREVDVRTGSPHDFPSEFMVTLKERDKDGEKTSFEGIISNTEPRTRSKIEELIAPIFPYISSNPTGGEQDVAPETEVADKRYATRGMGLFLLIQTVCHMFDGEVEFRSGRIKMSVTRRPGSAKLPPENGEKTDHFQFAVNIEVSEANIVNPAGTHIVCKLRGVNDAQQVANFARQ